MNSNVVSAEWLVNQLGESNVRVFDCRFDLANPSFGQEAYSLSHIAGAVFLDLEKDLSSEVKLHGGRHPLPDIQEFARKIGEYGVDEQVTVVAYDDQNGAYASRLWWLLRYMGHSNVYVLDGGFSKWKSLGYPVSDQVMPVEPKFFKPHLQPHLLVSMEDVKKNLQSQEAVVLDSREYKRYLGLEEPIDPVAGHIPGARHAFWKEGIREDGSWKNKTEQAERFKELDQTEMIIVYCGSGVTACPNILALSEAGFKHVKLYAGSWSDWCSYSDNPITTGEEKG